MQGRVYTNYSIIETKNVGDGVRFRVEQEKKANPVHQIATNNISPNN